MLLALALVGTGDDDDEPLPSFPFPEAIVEGYPWSPLDYAEGKEKKTHTHGDSGSVSTESTFPFRYSQSIDPPLELPWCLVGLNERHGQGMCDSRNSFRNDQAVSQSVRPMTALPDLRWCQRPKQT